MKPLLIEENHKVSCDCFFCTVCNVERNRKPYELVEKDFLDDDYLDYEEDMSIWYDPLM